MILSDREIKESLKRKEIKIEGIKKKELFIGSSSVDLHLDNDAQILEKHGGVMSTLDPKTIEGRFKHYIGWDKITILPEKFYILSTKEFITLPNNIAGFMHGRSSFARIGLNIHAAGFFDPGFSGNATLEVTNFTNIPIILYNNQRICQMIFMKLGTKVDVPYGNKPDSKYQNQKGPKISKIHEDKL